jgi:hypothetical protein
VHAKRGDETGGTWLTLNLTRFCVGLIPSRSICNFSHPLVIVPKFRVSGKSDNESGFKTFVLGRFRGLAYILMFGYTTYPVRWDVGYK